MKSINRPALRGALKALRRAGIAANMERDRQGSAAHDAMERDGARGYASASVYGEDSEEPGAWIDFGVARDLPGGAPNERAMEALAREVKAALEVAGLRVTWDGRYWSALHVEPDDVPDAEAFYGARDAARNAVQEAESIAHNAALALGYARMGLPNSSVNRPEVEAGLKAVGEAAQAAHAALVGALDWRWYPQARESLSASWLRLVALNAALAQAIR